ncbi:MAG: hypothetical protein ACTSP3_00165 [Candidatus Heimdallarchaeaceae archaeon]
MKDKIKKLVKNLANVSDDFENNSKTEFGKEFSKSCKELEDYVRSSYIIPIITKLYKIIRELLKSEDVISTVDSIIDDTTQFEPDQKKLAKLGWEGLHTEVKQDDSSFIDLENQISDFQIISRMTEYYILKLYAYFDIYSMSLFQYIISTIETDVIFDVLSKVTKTSNPLRVVEALLKSFNVEETDFFDPKHQNVTLYTELIESISKTNWEYDLFYVENFIKFRNIIAHRKKLASLKELEKRFPKQVKSANNRLKSELQNVKKTEDFQKILDFFVDMGLEKRVLVEIDTLLEDLKYFLTIREIGTSCYRYILLIDNIIYLFFNS